MVLNYIMYVYSDTELVDKPNLRYNAGSQQWYQAVKIRSEHMKSKTIRGWGRKQ